MKEDIQEQVNMKNKTDIEGIRNTTIAMAELLKPEMTKYIVVIHPFVETEIWGEKYLETKDIEKSNLLNDEVYEEWKKDFRNRINKLDMLGIYIQWRDAWKLTFMKYCGEYLSDKEYAEMLADAWVTEENPNMDANVSRKEALKMFKKCKKEYLMEREDYEYYKNLPEKVVLYRGVANGRILEGLSWTDNKEKAIWFKNRWNSNGILLKVKVDKKDIIAYFNTRNEQECLLDVFKYKNKIKEIHKI